MKLAGAYINDDTYGRLVAMAAANNRTLAGECRHLFDRALRGELQVPEGPGTPPPQSHAPMAQAAGMAAASPWQPSASAPLGAARPPRAGPRQEALRAVPRVLAALKAGPLPGSPVKPLPAVNAALNPPSVPGSPANRQLVTNASLNPQPKAGAALNPLPITNAGVNPQPRADAMLNLLPVAKAAAAKAEPAPRGALRGCENVPVAGVGVVAGMPVGIGIVATPALSPATGLSRPVRSAFYTRPGEGDEDGNGDEDGEEEGEEDGEEAGDDARRNDACFFQSPPLSMSMSMPMPMPNTKTNPMTKTNTNPNHPRPCLHTTPSLLPHPAPPDAHEPRTPARRMPR